MFVVHEDMTIYATRGDAVYFPVEKKVGELKYKFQPNDVVRFKVVEKKNYSKVVLMKDFLVEAECTSVNIFLSRFDMKFGEIINKPVDYWYEVELNPDTVPDTFIGYNESGPMLFKLFPEAKDVVEGDIPDPEEESAVARMTITFVNEYMGENAEVLVRETFDKYVAEHPLEKGEDGVGIESAVVDDSGNLVLTYTNGDIATVGHVRGTDGKDGKNGISGATFTPKVDAEGNLSWTNDRALENPATVNIRGATGEPGATGQAGKDGVDGYTPVKGKDYYTEADEAEMEAAVLAHFSHPSKFNVVKSGSTVTITAPLANGMTSTSVITLDANNYPVKVVTDDVECQVTWEGFE